jgi:hypothetical protein
MIAAEHSSINALRNTVMIKLNEINRNMTQENHTNTFALPKSQILTWWVRGSTCQAHRKTKCIIQFFE